MSDMIDASSRRYEIVCKLAGGGMADLYLGRTLGPGGFERLVVIKRLAKRLASDPSAVQALFDEARIAATLSHANIVQVTDVTIAEGQVSIVMEFLHGHDVAHLLRRMRKRRERVPLDQAIAIVLAVCAGLHHAHERVDSEGRSLEIVHRDVSPHNVFVTYDGAIKLVDFGIARASLRTQHTEHGFIKGKPGYIAPEQIRGRKLDRRTDVWGAAVLLYELTTGVTPYGSGTSFEELMRVTKEDAPAPSTRILDYPAELEAIVLRGLARDPRERFETAEDMRLELETFARARGLDLSPFGMAALMERVFAENLEAWHQSQRMGRSLAEHVAAFKTSGAHELVDLPGDPTEPFVTVDPTRTLVTSDLVVVSHLTLPTRLIDPPTSPATIPTPLLRASEPIDELDASTIAEPPAPVPAAPRVELSTTAVTTAAVLAPVDACSELASKLEPDLGPASGPVVATLHRPRHRKPLVVGVAASALLLTSLLAWGALGPKRSRAAVDTAPAATPHAAVELPRVEPRATAVNDKPVAHPVTVVPIEPEPASEIESAVAEPAEPTEVEPSAKSRIETAVAHAPRAPARNRPTPKSASKRREPRTTQARAASPPPPPQLTEDDLDALLPR